MKPRIFILLAFAAVGCHPSGVTTTWKGDNPVPSNYHRIVVVAIFKSDNDSLKTSVEKAFVKKLSALGYNAVSSLAEFGPGGLSNMGEATTYKKLCEQDIDGVLTIALVDANKEPPGKVGVVHPYPNDYYYTHIWNYKNMSIDISKAEPDKLCYWETVLFNLNTLQAECTIQSDPFKQAKLLKSTRDFETKSFTMMTHEKILVKQKAHGKLKPF